MAGMLGKLWDDVAGGSAPDQGLKQLRKATSGNARQFPDAPSSDAQRMMERRFNTGAYDSPEGSPTSQTASQTASQNIAIAKSQKLGTLDVNEPMAGSPSSLGSTPPASPTMADYPREKDNVWRSVFHPGRIKTCARLGQPNLTRRRRMRPTVYDWMYSDTTKSEYR